MLNVKKQPLITEQEAAKRLCVSVHKLRADRHHSTGIPYVKIGKLVRYHPEDLDTFISEQKVTPL